MKLIKKEISGKDQSGFVILIPEDLDDLWEVYNIIEVGDSIKSSTFRRVISQKRTAVTSQKKRTNITLQVKSVDFDSIDGIIRVSGQNIEKNDNIMLGEHHTSEIEVNRKFTLNKSNWDYVTLQRLNKVLDVKQKAKLAAILMQQGLCNICLVTNNLTLVRSKIEKSFPKKKGNFSSVAHKDAKEKFYQQILLGLLKHIDLSVVNCVLVGSTGFLNQEFLQFIKNEISKYNSNGSISFYNTSNNVNNQGLLLDNQMKILTKKSSIFVLVHCTTALTQSLEEILTKPEVLKRIESVSSLSQVATLNKFFEILRKDPNQAVYSLKYVNYCLDQSAVSVLLISDSLFRSNDVKERRYYVDLVERCIEHRVCEVVIFSSIHITGKKLDGMTGIAAILRYPIIEIDDLVNSTVEENLEQQVQELKIEESKFEVFF